MCYESSKKLLHKEILHISSKQVLLKCNDFVVMFATSNEISSLMYEIGRLREKSFSENGQGTGSDIDIDRFDFEYTHIFVWNRASKEIIAGCRLGLTDLILKNSGNSGLYTNKLFYTFDSFIEYFSCSIEMGRVFINSKYKKQFLPLRILWQGIFLFAISKDKYSRFFGSLSISQNYSEYSKAVILKYIMKAYGDSVLAEAILPRNPYEISESALRFQPENPIKNTKDLDLTIRKLERNVRGIPILLKHYLNLNVKVLGFCLDHDFSNTLDILVSFDISKETNCVLEKYLGKKILFFKRQL